MAVKSPYQAEALRTWGIACKSCDGKQRPDASPQGAGDTRCLVGAIGVVRSNGIRHRPMLFDGITPPTPDRHTSLRFLFEILFSHRRILHIKSV